jgi:hypothetical protein
MKAALAVVVAFAVLPFAQYCAAQEPPAGPQPKEAKAKPPTGIVTGTAYCADTNLPARNAQIILVSASGDKRGIQSMASTDLNGRFALRKVPEGRYYIAAMLPGYVDPLAQVSASSLSAMPADKRKEFEAHNTAVDVSAGQPANVSLRLERGTEIDGTVTYDDGSPAISLQIELRPKIETADAKDLKEEPIFPDISALDQEMRLTDDRGHFRIPGVPPGEYIVSASVPTMAADPAGPTGFAEIFDSFPVMGGLLVYAGGGLRASTAKTIKVTAGGASADADIIIPLSKMHAIHGEVLLKSTGQPPLFSVVELVYADTGEHARFSVQSNGRFDLWFVPEESYVLRAVAGPDAMPNVDFDDEEGAGIGFVGGVTFNASSSMKEAGAVEIPLLVKGDVEDITIRVPDPKPLEHAAPSEAPGQGEVAAPPQ